jgi:transcriptional regulator with XRE-family HTH domain
MSAVEQVLPNPASPHTLKEYRVAALLSQAEFAEKLGVSRSALTKWERGVSTPKITVKRRVAEAMKREFQVPQDRIIWPETHVTRRAVGR